MNGPVPSHIQRLRAAIETDFGTDQTDNLASFLDIPANEPGATYTLDPERSQNPGYLLQNMLDYQVEVQGKRGWSLSFTMNLAPTGEAAGDATGAKQGALGFLLKGIMGGEHLGSGSVASDVWTSASSGSVDDPSGFAVGGAAIYVDASGRAHMSEIEKIEGDNLTLKREFPETPSSGSVIYSAATYFWTQDPTDSFQFIVEGQESDDRMVLVGGQGTFTPSFNLDGTIQTVAFEFQGVKAIAAEDALGASSLSGTELGMATYENYSPIAGHAGCFDFTAVGTTERAEVDISEFSLSHNITNEPIPSPCGVEGVARYRRIKASGASLAEGSFTTFFEDWDAQDLRSNTSPMSVFYVCGVEVGKLVGVSIPTVQVTDCQRVDANGIASETVSFKARLDSETVEGSASALGKSPQRYHLG